MGMIVANKISVNRNILDSNFASRIENVCLKILNLELKSEWFDFNKIISAIRKDKKQTDTNIKAVLMNQNLSLEVKSDVEEVEIKRALVHLDELLFGMGGGHLYR